MNNHIHPSKATVQVNYCVNSEGVGLREVYDEIPFVSVSNGFTLQITQINSVWLRDGLLSLYWCLYARKYGNLTAYSEKFHNAQLISLCVSNGGGLIYVM